MLSLIFVILLGLATPCCILIYLIIYLIKDYVNRNLNGFGQL